MLARLALDVVALRRHSMVTAQRISDITSTVNTTAVEEIFAPTLLNLRMRNLGLLLCCSASSWRCLKLCSISRIFLRFWR